MSDSGKPFHCRRCDVLYTPTADQWIFHELCDECFALFNEQKMRGRFSGHADMFRTAPPEVLATMGIADPEELTTRPVVYYESSKEWIAAVGKKLRS